MNLEIELSAKQTEAIRLLQDDHTTEVLYGGGAGGGKSYLGTWWVLKNCLKYPGTRWVIGRSKLKTLRETTLRSLQEVMKMVGVTTPEHYKYNQVSGTITFYNGSEILLKDLFAFPADPDFDELGSLEISGAFIDEASQITAKAKNVIQSRIRFKLDEFKLIPKLLMTCNPTRNFLYKDFYKPHVEGTLMSHRAFVRALLSDNTKCTDHYRESLVKMDDESLKARLLFGEWNYLDDPTKLIEIDKIIDLWSNAHVRPGPGCITCDVARFGKDKTVIMVWSGLIVKEIKTISKSTLTHVKDVIQAMKIKHKIPASRIIIDDGGVGGGLVDMIPGCKPFIANKKPIVTTRRQNYANLKSQLYFTLAEYVMDSKIWIKPIQSRDVIIEELEQVKKDKEETDDKLRVVKKQDVKEMLGRSPDYSDCLSFRMWFEIEKVDYFA